MVLYFCPIITKRNKHTRNDRFQHKSIPHDNDNRGGSSYSVFNCCGANTSDWSQPFLQRNLHSPISTLHIWYGVQSSTSWFVCSLKINFWDLQLLAVKNSYIFWCYPSYWMLYHRVRGQSWSTYRYIIISIMFDNFYLSIRTNKLLLLQSKCVKITKSKCWYYKRNVYK